jgi:hypothetical protein
MANLPMDEAGADGHHKKDQVIRTGHYTTGLSAERWWS